MVDRPGSRPRRAAAVRLVAFVAGAACLVPACGSGHPRHATPVAPPGASVVVASFNFSESIVLAEIYARALEAAGVPVRRESNLGPRELVEPALQQGLVDVLPEYLGTALASVEPASGVDPADPAAVRRELARVVRQWGLQVLTPAPAQDQNGFVVTRATAQRLGLRKVSDLGPVARELSLGGPPECPQRPYCMEGLKSVYGLQFGRFLPFASEDQRVEALSQQVADVAVVFTTDAHLATGDLVLLADDRRLQPAENVAPMVSSRVVSRYGAKLVQTLDAVSAKLTTQSLVFLNYRVLIAGKDVGLEARGWLERQGLIPRSG